ncbi:hypothetical protein PZ897_13465, partial [Hoeflea sp. YIM 152468]|uniref:hypothetical protein n=1 Tax=Hoeflea sp. YIM 152468 TaxID=3031759 RepID=UPI0023DABFF3
AEAGSASGHKRNFAGNIKQLAGPHPQPLCVLSLDLCTKLNKNTPCVPPQLTTGKAYAPLVA